MTSSQHPNSPIEDDEDDDYDPTKDKTCEKVDRVQSRLSERSSQHRSSLGTASDHSGQSREQSAPTAAKRAKIDSIFEQLQAKTRPSIVSRPNPLRTVGSLAGLCRPVQPSKDNADKFWMRSLGVSSKGVSKVQAETKDKKAVAAAALAAVSSSASLQTNGKVIISETRKFAGEEIQVTKAVTADSKLAKKAAEAAGPKSGLDVVLDSLQGPKKLSVMDKTRKDWSGFKQENKEMEEELDMHVKSNDTYLEKVDFLKRSELREYEKERDARLGSDMRTRGRL